MHLNTRFARRPRVITVLVIVLTASACNPPAARHPGAASSAEVTTQPATRPTTARSVIVSADVEVRYAGYTRHARPQPLSPERKRRILEFAAEDAPADRQVWFILVLQNDEESYGADVYFHPDHTTPRLRRGRYAHVSDQREWLKKLRERVAEAIPRGRGELPTYVQVSAVEEPFDSQLTIPSLKLMPFNPINWPSGESAGLSDGEIVALTDLARPAFATFGEDEPLHAIRLEEGLIRVYSGWLVGDLIGGGQYIDFRRKPSGGFERVGGVGRWVS